VRHAAELPAAYRAGVTLLAYSGLRVSEALGLRWCDVDLVENELHVRGQLQPRRGKRDVRASSGSSRMPARASWSSSPPSPPSWCGCSSSSSPPAEATPTTRCSVRVVARRSITATSPCAASRLPLCRLNVWTCYYARSFGKEQRDEARARLLEHGFGVVVDED